MKSTSALKRSEEKMTLRFIKKPDGNLWVEAVFDRPSFVPSFVDLARIIRTICICEDKKYPDRDARKMVLDFLRAAVYEDDFDKLASTFLIPRRP